MFLYVYFFFSSSLSVAVSDFDFLLLAVNETRTFSRAMNVYRSNVLPECICRKREGKTKSGLEVQTNEGGGTAHWELLRDSKNSRWVNGDPVLVATGVIC